MRVTDTVKSILANYESDSPGTKANLARILMQGRLGGTGRVVILPVDQEISSAVRADFSESVHQRKVSGIKSYWQAQIFSGRGVPPLEKTGDEEVIAFVRSNPGAIGYVSFRARTDDVRSVRIVD